MNFLLWVRHDIGQKSAKMICQADDGGFIKEVSAIFKERWKFGFSLKNSQHKIEPAYRDCLFEMFPSQPSQLYL